MDGEKIATSTGQGSHVCVIGRGRRRELRGRGGGGGGERRGEGGGEEGEGRRGRKLTTTLKVTNPRNPPRINFWYKCVCAQVYENQCVIQ